MKLGLEHTFVLPRNDVKTMNAKFISLDIIPDQNHALWKQWEPWIQKRLQEASKAISKKLSGLGPGRHTICLKIDAESAEDKSGNNFMWQTVAQGHFILHIDEKGAASLTRAADRENWISAMPKAGMKDANLERHMADAIRNRGETRKIVRIVITERGWTIVKNSITGITQYRAISASVALKENDGTCKVYQWGFTQPYVGGSFGALDAQDPDQIGPNSIKNIECSDVMK